MLNAQARWQRSAARLEARKAQTSWSQARPTPGRTPCMRAPRGLPLAAHSQAAQHGAPERLRVLAAYIYPRAGPCMRAHRAGCRAKRTRRRRSTAPQNASGSSQDAAWSSGRSRAASPVRPLAQASGPWRGRLQVGATQRTAGLLAPAGRAQGLGLKEGDSSSADESRATHPDPGAWSSGHGHIMHFLSSPMNSRYWRRIDSYEVLRQCSGSTPLVAAPGSLP